MHLEHPPNAIRLQLVHDSSTAEPLPDSPDELFQQLVTFDADHYQIAHQFVADSPIVDVMNIEAAEGGVSDRRRMPLQLRAPF